MRFCLTGQRPRIADWRRTFGYLSHEKRLTIDTILAMTAVERREFWEGYMSGDGCRTNSAWHFDSTSLELAEGMQVLTLTLGYGCRIVSYDCMAAGREMINPQGNTYLARQSWRGHVLRKRPVAHIRRPSVKPVDLAEEVYCVRTSSGYFLARTAGKPFVAGNCDSVRYCVMNEFDPKGSNLVVPELEQAAQVAALGGADGEPSYAQEHWFGQMLAEKAGIPYEPPAAPAPRPRMTIEAPDGAPAFGGAPAEDEVARPRGRRGGLVWDLT